MTTNGNGKVSNISVDIIVPIHNGLECVKECLASLALSVRAQDRIILVDDGSDRPTQEFCEIFAANHKNTRLIRRNEGSGFTKAANAGLRESTADYQILLNSDTIVPEGWIEKILRCGESAPDIGLIGPLSNAASWQSIPEIYATPPDKGLAVNDLPDGTTIADLDRLCQEWAKRLPYPRTTLLNGFCLATKKPVRDSIGLLDETHFPLGYGEENDYCLRASDAGFAALVAIDTYVFHAKSKSYPTEKRQQLKKAGSKILRELHGEERIDRLVQSMQNHPILVTMREKAKAFYDERNKQMRRMA